MKRVIHFSFNQATTTWWSLSFAIHAQNILFHGQPFARAHCSTSRCPPNAADEHVSASHRQAVRTQPLQHLEAPASCRCLTKAFLIRQATSPLQARHGA